MYFRKCFNIINLVIFLKFFINHTVDLSSIHYTHITTIRFFVSLSKCNFKYSSSRRVIKLSKKQNLTRNFVKINNYLSGKIRSIFNDPYLNQQWYFMASTSTRIQASHRLFNTWNVGITGQNIMIAILGGGVEVDHKDLKQNHIQELSYNFLHNTHTVYPSHHGLPTNSIGLASAVANNFECGVGAAPDSKFANFQIIDDNNNIIEDSRLARALNYNIDKIHIYLLNWSQYYTLNLSDSIGENTITSLNKVFKFGRNALGGIILMGSGDDHMIGNNCEFNGLLQRPEVLVIGAYFSFSSPPKYLERCTAILAASISSRYKSVGEQLYSTTSNNDCKNSSGGSTSSAAIAAGIFALVLSINPIIDVRQLMLAIILSSIQYDRFKVTNAAKYQYSYNYGFGLLDAQKLILISKSSDIANLSAEHICSTFTFYGRRRIQQRSKHFVYIYTSGCLDSSFCVSNVEQVFIIFTIKTIRRYTIKMWLTSSKGTRLRILERRYIDRSSNGFSNWRIKIMGFFGEEVVGIWKLEIDTRDNSAELLRVELIFHGTCIDHTINLYTHAKVQKFIIYNIGFMKSKQLIKIYSASKYNLEINPGIDCYSFTGVTMPLIDQLIYLLYPH